MPKADDSDPLKLLKDQISAHPPFDRQAELVVSRRAHAGDAGAQEALVIHNLGLVLSVANRYKGRHFRLEDLVQEGCCGLVKATEHFDPERGFRFNTYAVWWIEAYILRALSRGPGVVVRPRAAGGPLPYDLSLDEAVAPGAELTHLDLLADEGPTPDETATREELSRQVRIKLARVRRRMGELGWNILVDRLTQEEPRTLQEIGEEWGLSRERVRQVEASTRRFLAGYLAGCRDAA